MAHNQQRQPTYPYQPPHSTHAYPDYPPSSNTGVATDYPPAQHSQYPTTSPGQVYQFDQQPQAYTHQNYPPHQDYDEQQSNWETKSTKSYQSGYGSQVHLNPQYEMSQVQMHNAPPLPAMPYQQNYPPVNQRPPMMHAGSSGWNSAREKLMKRRSVRQVELQQGNLVLDMPVPTHIVPQGMDSKEEMTKLRYTAATCDPDDFMRQKYSLRPYLYGRRTELFIVMTMYNEDEVLFCKTMNASVYLRWNTVHFWLTVCVVSLRTLLIYVVEADQVHGVPKAGRKLSSASSLMDVAK